MKLLAKLGLVTAAAATVLFIFIYEFQGPVINKVMSEPPTAPASVTPLVENIEVPITSTENSQETETGEVEVKVETEVEETEDLTVSTLDVEESTNPVAAEEPVVERPVETEEIVPAGPTRRIYGKITLSDSGEQLGGVNIMVPGSTVAKVSNPNGGYTIEIPERTRELVFIYRGKKLTQRLSPENSLLNVALNLETMQYD